VNSRFGDVTMAHETPQGENAEARSSKRHRWIAVLLAVLLSPFFSMLYVGRARRAVAYLALTVLAIGAPSFLASAGFWPKGMDWSPLGFMVQIAGAVDSYRIARRNGPDFAGPWYSRWYGLASVFVLIIFLVSIRLFVIEPFRIPSGAMIPTLLVGDFILVNRFTYGIRLPVVNVKLLSVNDPKRGEVIVFRFPENPSLDYIKRVVGLPGDEVNYRDKRLVVNGMPVSTERQPDFKHTDGGVNLVRAEHFTETLGEHAHGILINPEVPPVQLVGVREFPHRRNCEYSETGFTCKVPAGHYFVMGDNRDSSSDSRYWGFVPSENIVGKAFMIWWNTEAPERAGMAIR
jgi:signal peptidase I